MRNWSRGLDKSKVVTGGVGCGMLGVDMKLALSCL
jgi:hypothetical protein